MIVGIGEIAAFCAAAVWAFSTLLYKRFSHHLNPLELNVAKGVIASALMGVILLLTWDSQLPTSHISWGWLIASGIVGIAIGDSAYFAALRNIGPARTLVIESLAPAIAGLLNIALLGVYLSATAWLGILVTTLGVVIAVKPSQKLPKLDKDIYRKGVLFALGAATCQAAGMVLSKGALNNGDISSLWAAMIRLAAGTLVVAMIVAVIKHSSLTRAITLKGIEGKAWLFAAVFFGTFIGLWLQLVSVNNTDPAVAQTIFSAAPLMVMTMSLIRREHVTRAMILGGITALVGIVLLLKG
ncbi:DMT family transporter [Pseudoalteromonas luteoviolacea]|uniref:DMT family transporter n=1 Tax=Pseudoalteromonas luteoviolacea TaxID=43657 RepID=UPI001FFD99E6|nr:DMT family transporter [Pseudoalteromonas luteoviolacea]